MTKLEYIEWGVASRVGETVYVNKRLKSYPKLKNALLTHENNHTDDFTMKDIISDMDIKELKGLKREYYRFIAENPSAWLEFFPIKKYGNITVFNLPLIFIWLLAGGLTLYIMTALM